MAGVSYYLMFMLLAGCGSFVIPFSKSKKDIINLGNYSRTSEKDYADQMASLKQSFLSTPGVKTVSAGPVVNKYLENLCNELIAKNEIFFTNLKTASVIILETESPLHFSLPRGEIFISRGLVSKYIKHESMLVGVLAYELVRSEKLLYPKKTIVPLGYISLEKVLAYNRLPLDNKMEVHKWAFHITTRAGYDGEYYLSFLQIQNRNTADFLLNVGDVNQINREESLFKAFLIKNPNEETALKPNSSKDFYTLLNKMREGTL